MRSAIGLMRFSSQAAYSRWLASVVFNLSLQAHVSIWGSADIPLMSATQVRKSGARSLSDRPADPQVNRWPWARSGCMHRSPFSCRAKSRQCT